MKAERRAALHKIDAKLSSAGTHGAVQFFFVPQVMEKGIKGMVKTIDFGEKY